MYVDGDIRMRLDDVNPTASTGIYLGSGDSIKFDSLFEIQHVRIISMSGTATIRVQYEV